LMHLDSAMHLARSCITPAHADGIARCPLVHQHFTTNLFPSPQPAPAGDMRHFLGGVLSGHGAPDECLLQALLVGAVRPEARDRLRRCEWTAAHHSPVALLDAKEGAGPDAGV